MELIQIPGEPKPEEPRYFPRDLSWLSFNYRVLMEAKNQDLPLYERLKFIAIYSSNLDEFFKVRIAAIQSLFKVKKKKRAKWGIDPSVLLEKILKEVDKQQQELGEVFNDDIVPKLHEEGIRLLRRKPEEPPQIAFMNDFFNDELRPYLQPFILQKGKIDHFLRENGLYLALGLHNKVGNGSIIWEADQDQDYYFPPEITDYAMVQIPTHYFSRFLSLPITDTGLHSIMFLDDVMRYCIHEIFPGYEIINCHAIKVTRNADLMVEDEFSGDLVTKIAANLNKRKIGPPTRFLYDEAMPKQMLRFLRDTFGVSKKELIPGGRYHGMSDLFGFPNPLSPQLETEPLPPLPYQPFEDLLDLFPAIRERDHLLHFPYHSYDYFIRFLNRAAIDPKVTHLKTTQYRVAAESAIVGALIRAAQNGKDVTVFVEIKARFDEERNIKTAQAMEEAGVRIIYSLPGLKVHAKVALVLRKQDKTTKGYAFLSTGNFNEKTAQIYADHGLFTADTTIIKDLENMFEFLQDTSNKDYTFEKLLVAQFNLKERFIDMIEREIMHKEAGKKAYILVKLNGLEDKSMIDKLYEASQAGVKVDLIVRGICCIRPGVPGLSENIRVVRLVDRFLEHARVFHFHNDGEEDLYLASADWMRRNLERRVETGFPITDKKLKSEVRRILELQLSDNVKAVRLNADMENIPVREDAAPIQAQIDTYRFVEEGILG